MAESLELMSFRVRIDLSRLTSVDETIMYAQTNIQLFEQFQREGYSSLDLSLIREAYELAVQLLSAFRQDVHCPCQL